MSAVPQGCRLSQWLRKQVWASPHLLWFLRLPGLCPLGGPSAHTAPAIARGKLRIGAHRCRWLFGRKCSWRMPIGQA